MILKKVNIRIEALDATAKVANVTAIAEDQSFVTVDLYEKAKRIKAEILDLDGNVFETKIGNFEPLGMLAKNRTFNKADAVRILGLTKADYEVFYPVVVEISEEELKAQKIAELEKTIAEATEKLEILKG